MHALGVKVLTLLHFQRKIGRDQQMKSNFLMQLPDFLIHVPELIKENVKVNVMLQEFLPSHTRCC